MHSSSIVVTSDRTVVSIFSREPVSADVENEELTQQREHAAQSLERIAEELRAGKMNDYVIVMSLPCGGMMSEFGADVFEIPINYIGALQRAIHKINTDMDEECYDSEVE